jgi:hypothetical protein
MEKIKNNKQNILKTNKNLNALKKLQNLKEAIKEADESYYIKNYNPKDHLEELNAKI